VRGLNGKEKGIRKRGNFSTGWLVEETHYPRKKDTGSPCGYWPFPKKFREGKARRQMRRREGGRGGGGKELELREFPFRLFDV